MKTKVIVVDDSNTSRRLVVNLLTAAGYEVIEAVDGLDGLRRIIGHLDARLVICDFNMPRMNGIEMLAAMRGIPRAQHMGFVMLAADQQFELARKLKLLGVHWLPKPMRPELVLSAVRKLTADPALGKTTRRDVLQDTLPAGTR